MDQQAGEVESGKEQFTDGEMMQSISELMRKISAEPDNTAIPSAESLPDVNSESVSLSKPGSIAVVEEEAPVESEKTARVDRDGSKPAGFIKRLTRRFFAWLKRMAGF